jgi:hypothetical protein
MKPRPPAQDDDGGLDSLMDTMTNVVGILILVLVMTQLDVQEALRKITSQSTVTAADVEEMKAKVSAAQQEQKQIEEQSASAAQIDVAAERERLTRLQQTLAAKKQLMKAHAEEVNSFSLALANDRKMAAVNQKEIEIHAQKREQLQEDLTDLLAKKADLKAMLDKTPRRAAAPPKQITVPNPRPAPPGTKQLSIACINNRLYPMNIDEIRKVAEEKTKELIVRQRLNLDPAAGIDPEKFEKTFTKLSVPDEFFDIEFYVEGHRYPRLRFVPREKRGASDEELQKSRSPMHKLLTSIDPQKFFLMFYVLPDSYEVYLTARNIVMGAGIEAGWDAVPQTWVYTTSVPGGIELGPPRPKPPAPTTPAPPAKPANVID